MAPRQGEVVLFRLQDMDTGEGKIGQGLRVVYAARCVAHILHRRDNGRDGSPGRSEVLWR